MNSKEMTDPKNDDCEAAHICPEEKLESSDTPGVETEEMVVETEEMVVEALADRLAKAEADGKAHWDNLLRTQAELDNLRKRAKKDVENAHKFALERFLEELLPVRDSMELGVSAASADVVDTQGVSEGAELTLKMFASVLEKFGVNDVNPEGQSFDPELHQAMSVQEVDGVESGMVTMVMQKGYTLNGRLVRPALVMVAK